MRRWVIAAIIVLVAIWVGLGVFTYASWKRWIHTKVVWGSGKVVRESRPISGVHAIESVGSWEVHVTQGSPESVEVETDQNLLPLVETTVTDGRLVISARPNVAMRPTREVRCYVTVSDLTAAEVSGSGALECGKIRTPDLATTVTGSGSITCDAEAGSFSATCRGSGRIAFTARADQVNTALSGSGQIEGQVRARRVESEISGSGWTKVRGTTEEQRVSISGSGQYHGEALKSTRSEATVNGSGEVWVGQTGRLNAAINGSGEVTYVGSPLVEQEINGSGSVHRAR